VLEHPPHHPITLICTHTNTQNTQAMLQDDILCLVLSHPAIKQFLYTPRHKSSPETLRTPPEGKTRTVFTVRYRCLCEIISCGNGGGENNYGGYVFLHSSILISVSVPVSIVYHNLPTFAFCVPCPSTHVLLHICPLPHYHVLPSLASPLLYHSTPLLLHSSTASLPRGVWELRELCE
jgi:hypothetical protein